MTNSGAKPLNTDWSHCTLHETLTDGAGTKITGSRECGVWEGSMSTEGLLRQGDRVTADFMIGDGDDRFAGKICHTGQWNVELTMETSAGTVRYPVVPFLSFPFR